jgi:predicted  nucleic acid-binding Zn-ribbon protein
MRKPVQVSLIAAIALLLVATTVLFVKYRNTNELYANAKASELDSQTRYAKTIDAIAEIQDSLSAIAVGDTNVSMLSRMGSEQQISGPDKSEALDRIAVLRSSILRNKERIRQLESSLKASGGKVAGLQRMLKNLKASVAEKEQLVADLSTRVDSLQTQVAGLSTEVEQSHETIAQREQTIEEKRRELATVFYVVGNKKELQDKGAVIAKGGLLGVGKTLLPAPVPNPGAFNALDTDQETTIDLGAAKAQVITAQPSDSYELVLVDGKMQLHILNPVEFRKVRQLVVMTNA